MLVFLGVAGFGLVVEQGGVLHFDELVGAKEDIGEHGLLGGHPAVPVHDVLFEGFVRGF